MRADFFKLVKKYLKLTVFDNKTEFVFCANVHMKDKGLYGYHGTR